MLGWIKNILKTEEGTSKVESPAEKPVEAPPIKLAVARTDSEGSGLSRQVILNREYHAVGYLFSLRHSSHQRLASGDMAGQKAADQVLIRSFETFGVGKLAGFRQIWFSILDETLLSPSIEALPPEATVLILRFSAHHGASPAPALLERARALRQIGFRLALVGLAETPEYLAWLPLADIVMIDAQGSNPAEINDFSNKLRRFAPKTQLMGRRIDSVEEFEFCFKAKLDLFSGDFLTKRENWPPQPRLSPDRTRVCDLLNRLRNGQELNEIAEVLRQSAALSYRLLRYINSAGGGVKTKIASVEQALIMLGREKLYRWLTLLLFNTTDGQTTDALLLEQALVRGRIMELASQDRLTRVQSEELFIVGVFSVLDLLLRQPMSISLEPLKLPTPVQHALIDEQGPYAPYLQLAVACESSDEESMAVCAGALGMGVHDVTNLQIEAIGWAHETMG